ncbi:hypothetical protein [Variovorax beijingensis]|uniref:hypothetical protein n=1 Tax=Variovorax beijingensis TaxID=2496117 RepID=UPI001CB98919|nr:hypothetical protein [Variovorax beijingensis]
MDAAFFGEHKGDLEALRRNAVTIGQGKKFLIDISRFEYTDGKQEADLDGYRIYVYSPTMNRVREAASALPTDGRVQAHH